MKEAKAQAKAQADYLKQYGTGQQRYLDYLQGLGPRTTTETGGETGESTGFESTDMLTAPEVSAQFSPLVERMNQIASQRLAGPGAGLPPGYAENAVRAINESFAPQEAAERNRAAQLGLPSGAVGPVSAAGRAKAGQIATLRGELPLKAREMETEDIGLAQQLANIFGKGTRQRGTRTSRETRTGQRFGTTVGPAPVAPMQAFLPAGIPGTTKGMGFQALGAGYSDVEQALARMLAGGG